MDTLDSPHIIILGINIVIKACLYLYIFSCGVECPWPTCAYSELSSHISLACLCLPQEALGLVWIPINHVPALYSEWCLLAMVFS